MAAQVGSLRGTVACAVMAACLATSCFYDSRWGESKRLQTAAAKHATPRELKPTEDASGPGSNVALKVMRIHAHATARHAAEVVDWPRQLAAVVDDANRVLGPTLNVRLEVVETKTWAAEADEQDLTALLDELRARDAGDGVSWVVGLAGSVPRAELSFHELGMARLHGKQLVMRAMNDAREYESIRKELSELGEAERAKLYAARKRHKATTVFLHEIAHTFGVLHQPDPAAIMSPRYSIKAERFSDAATEWMKLVLARPEEPLKPGEPRLGEALLALLQRTSESWVPAERDDMMARLRATNSSRQPAAAAAATAASTTATAGKTEQVTPPATAPTAQLAATDQSLFAEVDKDDKAGKPWEAFNRGKPLFSKYPDVYAVQELRCHLVMQLSAPWETVQAECAAMVRLGGLPAPSK